MFRRQDRRVEEGSGNGPAKICLGAHVPSLTKMAIEIAEKIGPVSVNMGDTECQVPFAPDYIRKIEKRGTIGKKRKTARC
jgi:hypothetical protein